MVNIALINKINRVNVSTNVIKTQTTNVIVAKQKTVQVSANATMGIIDSTSPVTLVNTPTLLSVGTQLLDQLKNVDGSNKVEGSTLVYETSNTTYVVKQLDMDYVTGGLHGGTF
jgi:hypothetical protein